MLASAIRLGIAGRFASPGGVGIAMQPAKEDARNVHHKGDSLESRPLDEAPRAALRAPRRQSWRGDKGLRPPKPGNSGPLRKAPPNPLGPARAPLPP